MANTPEKSPRKSPANKSTEQLSQGLPNPFETSPRRVAVKTEEEQQATAREREQQEMLAHKDARRKSLGRGRIRIIHVTY